MTTYQQARKACDDAWATYANARVALQSAQGFEKTAWLAYLDAEKACENARIDCHKPVPLSEKGKP